MNQAEGVRSNAAGLTHSRAVVVVVGPFLLSPKEERERSHQQSPNAGVADDVI